MPLHKVELTACVITEDADQRPNFRHFRKPMKLPFAPMPGLRVYAEKTSKHPILGPYVFTCSSVIWNPFRNLFEIDQGEDMIEDEAVAEGRIARLEAAGFVEAKDPVPPQRRRTLKLV